MDDEAPSVGQAGRISFRRLETVNPELLLDHMRDPRIARHLPLLKGMWDLPRVDAFLAAKAAYWARDGLGHWAIFIGAEYAGWGGFQKEESDWDFGLVLRPSYYTFGTAIVAAAFEWAKAHTAIERITCLLPLSRSKRALERTGARPSAVVVYANVPFRQWIWTLRPGRIVGIRSMMGAATGVQESSGEGVQGT